MKRLASLLALACHLSLAAPPATAAEPLGRMFFTPAQRVSLDAARTQRTRTTVGTEENVVAEKAPPPPQPEHVTYGGMVRRSDGKTTVWLNNRAVQDKDLRAAGSSITGKIRPDGRVTVQGAQSGHSVDLKVGQSAELLSGTVGENYLRPPLTAPKPEAKPEDKPAAKPGADAAANQAALERAKEERAREERRRDMEDAVRAAQNAAPAKPEVPQVPASQPPSR